MPPQYINMHWYTYTQNITTYICTKSHASELSYELVNEYDLCKTRALGNGM